MLAPRRIGTCLGTQVTVEDALYWCIQHGCSKAPAMHKDVKESPKDPTGSTHGTFTRVVKSRD